jgi:hypothetical protein
LNLVLELRRKLSATKFLKQTAFVFCCLTLLQGCEKPNNLLLGTLAVAGLMVLQETVSSNEPANTE